MARFSFVFALSVSLVLALAASSNASTFDPRRRDHAVLGRLIKKRAPVPQDLGAVLAGVSSSQAQQSPSISTVAQPTQDTSSVVPTTSAVQTPSSVAAVSTSASPSTTGDLLGSVVSGLLPTPATSTAPPSSVVSPTTPSSTSSHSSSTPQLQSSAQLSSASALLPSQSILYLTTSGAPTATQTSSSSSSSGMSQPAMTVLIVIAAIVGAAIIVWTIIRKWKFKPSSDFEGRMQPIDWQPGGSDEDTGLPGQHRPLSRASSFHSGSGNGHADDQMRGPIGGYGTSAVNSIPDHDFTAGPAHLTPIGGYADLARGPSPQPIMQEPLGAAPSISRPVQYDQYGVPLHHGYSGY